jgi:peroxiredoxin
MDNKQILGISVLVLVIIGGFGMVFFSNGKTAPINNAQQQENYQQPGESYDMMMERMHPSQPANEDMSSDDMSDHHGGAQISTDKTNIGMNTLSFSSAIGKTAPDFTLTKQDGSKFTLSDYKDKTVVLFFNEGSMCYPACWEQMASLGSDERFKKDDVIAASIVIDGKEKWDQVIRSQPKYGKGIILFDTNKAVSQAYDILNLPSSMHQGSFPGHTYVIIKNGVISYVLDDPNMALNNDKLALKI